MRNKDEAKWWVVYQVIPQGNQPGANAMCDQREWAELERANAGRYILIRSNIASEAEAERLARGTAGDTKPRERPKKTDTKVS